MGSENRCRQKERISAISKYDAFYTGGGVQITQDGRFMLCCCGDSIKIVDVASGLLEDTISVKENGELACFALADDDRTLVVAAKNGILEQWDFKERTQTKIWKSVHIGPVSRMAFDSTSTYLATGGSDSTVKIWDTVSKYYTHNFKGAQGVFSVICFYELHSGLTLFGAADDYRIRAWSLDSSKCIAVLEGHYSTVTSLQFCESKKMLLSGGRDKVVLLWDMADFTLLKTLPNYEGVESIILMPEGKSFPEMNVEKDDIVFITANSKGVLRAWNSATGKCIHSQEDAMASVSEDEEDNGQIITTQAFYNKALDAISIITSEHNILFYKLEDFSLVKQFVGYNDEILDVKFMGKKETHLAVATNSPLIRIYEISTFACQLLEGHKDIVVALDVFPKDRNMLISGSKDNCVLVWRMDPDTSKVHYLYMGFGHTHNVSAVVCSRNKTNFFLSASDDTTLKLWDIPAKKPMVALKVHLSVRCTVKAHDKTINSICVSTNDKLVATGSQDHTAKVWNTADLSLQATLSGHRKGVMCVQFSPVDVILATAAKDGIIKMWSLEDFSIIKNLEGHMATVEKVLFLSEGTQLLSSSCDGVIKLWNIKKSDCIQTEAEHTSGVWALTTTKKEDIIVSGAADSKIIVWKDVTEEKQKEEFEMHKNRVMNEQHLSNLMHEKKWVEALGLAITLDQPFRTLKIIDAILVADESGVTLHDTIAKLSTDQIEHLLDFVVEWNTVPRNSLPALRILNSVFRIKSPEELQKMTRIKEIVRSLLPYTERHYGRIAELSQNVLIANFLCRTLEAVSGNDSGMDVDENSCNTTNLNSCTVSCK